MDLPTRMAQFCVAHHLLPAGSRGVVCVSGGIDSVVLLAALRVVGPGLGLDVSAFHLHHGLRGEEADRDQAFVEDLCACWGVPLVVQRLEPLDWASPELKGRSRQEGARLLRYQRVLELAGDRWVATAHTRSDQAETVLARICRGTSVEGLMGIPVKRGQIVRPLLGESREAIEVWARATGLTWVEDSSNGRQVYERVRVRTGVLPMLRQELNPRVDDALVELAARAAQDHHFIESLVDQGWRDHTHTRGPLLFVELAWLTGLAPALQGRVLRRVLLAGGIERLEGARINALSQWLVSPGSRWPLPRGGAVWREGGFLCVDPHPVAGIPTQTLTVGQSLQLPAGDLSLGEGRGDQGVKESAVWSLNQDRVVLPLTVRSWQRGDGYRPLGGSGRRKLSDLFADSGVAARLRHQLPVVLSGDEIVWVGGVRGAEWASADGETPRVLKLEWSPRWPGVAAP